MNTQSILRELSKRRQFIIYAFIGVSGALLDYIAFIAMIRWLPVHYLLINAISTTLGISNNFFLNARLNFTVSDRLFSRFATFYSIGMLGLLVASALLYLLIDMMGVLPELAKLLSIIVIVLLQYNLNKRFSFKHTTS